MSIDSFCLSSQYKTWFLVRIVIAATFGSMIAGQSLSFTPDYLSAKVSAGRLFKLLDQKSAIDVNDETGQKKVYNFIFKIFFA